MVGPLGVGVTDGVGPLGVGVTDGVGPLGVGTLGVGVTEGVGPLGVGVTEGVGPLGVGVGGVTDGIAEETLGVLAIVVVGSVVETKTFIWYIKLFTFNSGLCRNQTYMAISNFKIKTRKYQRNERSFAV